MRTRSVDSQAGRNLKRKRRSSESSNDIENKPLNADKRLKQRKLSSEGESCNLEERLPLSKLPIIDHVSIELESCDISADNEAERFLTSSFSSPESNCEPLSVESLPDSIKDDGFPSTDVKTQFEDVCSRVCPWPATVRSIEWANTDEWWTHYVKSDDETSLARNPRVFDNHPGLQPRMRAVLLEWLIEVCDVFKLHRETYYLTLDYLDRYLESTKNVPKTRLQLIGISCLLIASKVEEIYPPKITEYAFVTDGACSEKDILIMELSIIKIIHWKFKSITPNCWLLIYLQLGYMHIRKERKFDDLRPLFPTSLYKTAAQLMDLVTLDINSLGYRYSILAISALHIVCSHKFPLHVSGYTVEEIEDCVAWMEVFWKVLNEKMDGESPSLSPSSTLRQTDGSYLLQQHVISMELLESAQNLSSKIKQESVDFLTPPKSTEKRST